MDTDIWNDRKKKLFYKQFQKQDQHVLRYGDVDTNPIYRKIY